MGEADVSIGAGQVWTSPMESLECSYKIFTGLDKFFDKPPLLPTILGVCVGDEKADRLPRQLKSIQVYQPVPLLTLE